MMKAPYVLGVRRAEAKAKELWRRTMEQRPADYPRMCRAVNRYLRLYRHHDGHPL
jgi:hypothetical protein